MKLSRTIGYAIQAALQLAAAPPGTKLTCHEMAEAGRMPERFLLQILRSMVTKGILRSTRGVNGGYTMIREPESVSLLDIVEAVEGSIGFDLPQPAIGHVAAYRTLTDVEEKIRHEMDAVKLSDLMASHKKARTPEAYDPDVEATRLKNGDRAVHAA